MRVKRWTGEIRNNEPDKCDQFAWFAVEALPTNIIPYVKHAIQSYNRGGYYSEFGWP
jgi:8-oxo-dGTP diphosphatase